jgi:tRNA(fMet)-specific endonuclease VapC
MTYLLDTNTVSYFLRDHTPRLTQRLMACAPETLAISTITAGELAYGLQMLGTTHRASILGLKLHKLLHAVSTYPVPGEAASHYGRVRHHLEAQGTPIGGNDLWIAAHALASDMTLITNNLHEFERVPGLKVEDWL